jgi:ABC-type Fe3+-hydroxamate transport system substrate-binding protein
MLSFTDQTGRILNLPEFPRRIVSLVPSQTELLYSLGLQDEVVGITKFCIHPDQWFRTKCRIGGTKNVRIREVLALRPDLVLANKEENVKEQVEELAAQVPVWVSDINTLEDALVMIRSVGALTGKGDEAEALSLEIENGFKSLVRPVRAVAAAYLIWKDPYMTVGADTFIHDMLERGGFYNVFGNRRRYPEVSMQELAEAQTEVLFLSSEPYPFRDKHIAELKAHLGDIRIELVDGELFSWYGSRLRHSAAYLKSLQRSFASLS